MFFRQMRRYLPVTRKEGLYPAFSVDFIGLTLIKRIAEFEWYTIFLLEGIALRALVFR